MLEFRAREGRDPDIDHADSDADKLKELTVEVLKSLGVSEDFLDLEFTKYVPVVSFDWHKRCYCAYSAEQLTLQNKWNKN